jgi:hypothetical protein
MPPESGRSLRSNKSNALRLMGQHRFRRLVKDVCINHFNAIDKVYQHDAIEDIHSFISQETKGALTRTSTARKPDGSLGTNLSTARKILKILKAFKKLVQETNNYTSGQRPHDPSTDWNLIVTELPYAYKVFKNNAHQLITNAKKIALMSSRESKRNAAKINRRTAVIAGPITYTIAARLFGEGMIKKNANYAEERKERQLNAQNLRRKDERHVDKPGNLTF